MIRNRTDKIVEIIRTIQTRISEINQRYRAGPDLYFYKRLMNLRNNSPTVESFLTSNYHLEILYATIVSWDMNTRAARMKYYDSFRDNLLQCLTYFNHIEAIQRNNDFNMLNYESILRYCWHDLHVMLTQNKLVSNSKVLHFLFPKLLLPMDGKNTLYYFYGNLSESINKYIEIVNFSFDVMIETVEWNTYLDDNWNQTVPKMIDNAIILLVGRSIS